MNWLKENKQNTKKEALKSKWLLNIIYTNIFEPFDAPSIGGEKYFITFTNNFSWYDYVYLLHDKSQSINVLEIYINEIDKQLNKKVKIVKSDRGVKYYGKDDELG